ncbi:type I glyceraldehyde-3-phosphate dehydrogenase, partial [Candidatus Kaiserbacteria bacterium]|nr:type I glyceraldehyde-3-phosphate dehydrogenase [Candidatus Kaiserbacteria bacterium]
MKTIRVAVNGFGRIGRAFVRAAHAHPELELIAVNDPGSAEGLAYLLKYDTVYRKAPFSVATENGDLIIAGKAVKKLTEKDPANLPWKDLAIDLVVESSGAFNDYEKASAHLKAGAQRVVISAPVKNDSPLGATVLMGLDEEKIKTCAITSNASCTTNSASPIIVILDEAIGIEKAILSTTHAYTASQSLVDGGSKKDLREG